MATHHEFTEDEYGIIFYNLLKSKEINPKDFEGGIISSVVPPLTTVLEKMCDKYLGFKPIVVGPGIKSGINIKYDNPKEVGADRIGKCRCSLPQVWRPCHNCGLRHCYHL